jgi:hypothetical protein
VACAPARARAAQAQARGGSSADPGSWGEFRIRTAAYATHWCAHSKSSKQFLLTAGRSITTITAQRQNRPAATRRAARRHQRRRIRLHGGCRRCCPAHGAGHGGRTLARGGEAAAAAAAGGRLLPPAAFVTFFDPDASGLPFAIARLLPDAAPFLRMRLLGLRMLRAGEALAPQAVGGAAVGVGADVASELSRLLVFPPVAGGHSGGALRVERAKAVPPPPVRPPSPFWEEALAVTEPAGAEAADMQVEAAAAAHAAAAAREAEARAAHAAALAAIAEAEAAGRPWSRKEASMELGAAAEGARVGQRGRVDQVWRLHS